MLLSPVCGNTVCKGMRRRLLTRAPNYLVNKAKQTGGRQRQDEPCPSLKRVTKAGRTQQCPRCHYRLLRCNRRHINDPVVLPREETVLTY